MNLLTQYLEEHQDELCDEHRELWRQNPLRVLDCKREACINVTEKGPMLIDHLCDDCRSHFERVLEGLASIGIETTLAPRLVRGFDYYNRTTFEFVADAFESAQNSIGGGGRYDQLAEELGGKPTSGIGFGSGIERILLAREAEGVATALLNRTLDAFVIDTTGDASVASLVEELRSAGFATDRAYDQRSMKAQMKAADRSGARFALLIGPEELAAGEVTIRDLRSQDFDQTQRRVARARNRGDPRRTTEKVIMPEDVEATAMRDLLCGSVNDDHVGERVSVCGWVAKRREHGEHLAFLDVRDRSGVVQAVVPGSVDVRSEYVVRVTGTVAPRPEGTVNDRLATGQR